MTSRSYVANLPNKGATKARLETIVLATDFPPSGMKSSPAPGIKSPGVGPGHFDPCHQGQFLTGMEGRLTAEAWPKLEKQAAQLEAQGLQVTMEMPSGLPAHSLQEVARCCGADLIVVGSHGKQEGILGSVSSAIVHHATTPIVLLPMGLKPEKPQGSCRLHCNGVLRTSFSRQIFPEISRAGPGVYRASGPQGGGSGDIAERPGRAPP